MKFNRFLTALTFMAIFAMAMRISVASDTWWHLRAGTWMLEHGQILSQDQFSLTMQGQPWIYPGWISQILMALIFQWLALPGLNIFTAVSVVVAFGFVWKVAEAPPLLKAFVFVLGAAVSGVFWSARPQILTFAMTGIFLWSIARARASGPRQLWLPVVLTAIWANLHGGFAIGLILLGIELVATSLAERLPSRLQLAGPEQSQLRPRHIGLAAIASAAAVSINPHGPRMLLYPLRTVSIDILQDYIQEWQSPNFHNIEVQPFLWMLLLTLVFMALSPRRPSWREVITVTLFAYLALLAGRNVALFGLLATPVLISHFDAVLQDRRSPTGSSQLPDRTARIINLGLLLLIGFAVALKSVEPLSAASNRQALTRQAPVAAAEYLREMPARRLFNSYNWGSYILWELYPSYQSFVDGRTDLFEEEILAAYLTAWRADPGWEAVLEQWDIQLALLEPTAPLSGALQEAGWEIGFQDSSSIILERGG
jgi:hypothetical protein